MDGRIRTKHGKRGFTLKIDTCGCVCVLNNKSDIDLNHTYTLRERLDTLPDLRDLDHNLL